MREEVQEVLRKEYARVIANYAVTIIDKRALGEDIYVDSSVPRAVLTEACSRVEERCIKVRKSKLRDPGFDFDAEMSIFPLHNKVLLLPFVENKEAFKIIEGQPWIKPYGYWDNVDPDINCNAREWAQRKKDWDKALPGIGIPSQSGLTVQLHPSFMRWPTIKEIKASIPKLSERAEIRTRDLAVTKLAKKKYEKIVKEEAKGKRGESLDHIRATSQAIMSLHESPEGKRLKKEILAEVRGKLPKRITRAMLLEKLSLKPRKKIGKSNG